VYDPSIGGAIYITEAPTGYVDDDADDTVHVLILGTH